MSARYGYQSAEAWSAARAAFTWSTVVSVSAPAGSEPGSPLSPVGCSSFTPAASPPPAGSPGEEPQADSSTATDTDIRTGIQRFTSTSRPDGAFTGLRHDPGRSTSVWPPDGPPMGDFGRHPGERRPTRCLLYTSDAADDLLC